MSRRLRLSDPNHAFDLGKQDEVERSVIADE